MAGLNFLFFLVSIFLKEHLNHMGVIVYHIVYHVTF